MYVKERPVAMSPDDFTEGTNQNLTITYAAAGQGLRHVVTGVAWSFNSAQLGATPALTIMDGTNVIFRIYIVAGGPGSVQFDPPKVGATNSSVAITLEAGGAGVVGTLNVLGHWVEAG